MENVLLYTKEIGKIVSIAVSLIAILWSLISFVQSYIKKIKASIEEKDWNELINVINELVLAAEEKFAGEESAGAQKKEEVIKLLTSYGYEVNEVIEAFIESAVYSNFNSAIVKKMS